MYKGLLHLHSYLPYLFLSLLLVSTIVFIVKNLGKKSFGKADKMLALFTLIFAHTQATVGIILYFVSPIVKAALSSGEIMSNDTYRFYAVEHLLTMLFAVILITVGYSKSKKSEGSSKFKKLSIFYSIALILVLSRIPWEAWLG